MTTLPTAPTHITCRYCPAVGCGEKSGSCIPELEEILRDVRVPAK